MKRELFESEKGTEKGCLFYTLFDRWLFYVEYAIFL